MPFDGLGLHADLVKAVHEMGYTRPSPIQAEAIPVALAGRDLIGTAQTGTGKTAAFLLPILHRMKLSPESGKGGVTRGLVLAPTRELAVQGEVQLRKLAKYTGIRSVAIYGGSGMEPQRRALVSGVEIIIATPGRLLDHIKRKNAKLGQVTFLVLDEADRMLDMGFLPDIRKIVATLPKKRQTMLFSATMPGEIARLAGEILNDPMTIHVGGTTHAAVGIRHAAYPVPQHLKIDLLLTLLRDSSVVSVLIFIRTKHSADRLMQTLKQAGFAAGALHANRTQSERLRTLESFRNGQIQVLVATDIASRGIDVSNISHVINFDLPNSPETYIHRVGRTGRAEAVGDAFTLVTPGEEKMLRIIEKHLGPAIPRVKLPDFQYRAPTSSVRSAPAQTTEGPSRRPYGARTGGSRSGSDRPGASGNSARPRTGAPRSPERPRTGEPRNSDRPRTGGPRNSERPRTGAPRNSDRPRGNRA